MYDCRMMRISLSGSTDILVFVSPMLEYKFTCMSVSVCLSVCLSVTLCVNSFTGQTFQRIFTVDSLNDADLRKNVPFGVSMMNNHI